MISNLSKKDLRALTNNAAEAAVLEIDAQVESFYAAALKLIKVEVVAGRHYAVVMGLRKDVDYETSDAKSKVLEPSQLRGAAAKVYARFETMSPELHYWSKTGTTFGDSWTDQGFTIVVHWKTLDDLIQQVASDDALRELQAALTEADLEVTSLAAKILAKLHATVVTRAKAGQSWAVAMSLVKDKDYFIPEGETAKRNDFKMEWLSEVGHTVWDACADLSPTIEYWSHNVSDYRGEGGVECGFNIVVHW